MFTDRIDAKINAKINRRKPLLNAGLGGEHDLLYVRLDNSHAAARVAVRHGFLPLKSASRLLFVDRKTNGADFGQLTGQSRCPRRDIRGWTCRRSSAARPWQDRARPGAEAPIWRRAGSLLYWRTPFPK